MKEWVEYFLNVSPEGNFYDILLSTKIFKMRLSLSYHDFDELLDSPLSIESYNYKWLMKSEYFTSF